MKSILSENTPPAKPPFKITHLVLRTLVSKWKQTGGPKEKLVAKQEKEPTRAAEIEKVIKQVEDSQDILVQAADKFLEQSKKATEIYQSNLGTKGKIQQFFGFDNKEKLKKIKFSLVGEKFELNSQGEYTIKDVTSPGFDISLFLPDRSKAKELIKQAISYREILNPDSSKDKEIQPDNLPSRSTIDQMIADLTSGNLSENEETPPIFSVKIKEKYLEWLEKLSEILKTLEGKDLATVKAKTKIAYAYREHPAVSLYYQFGKSEKLKNDKVMKSFKNPMGLKFKDDKIIDLLQIILKDINSNKQFDEIKIEDINEAVKNKDFNELSRIFRSDKDKKDEKTGQEASKELERLKGIFEQEVDKKIKELQKGIPLFVEGESDAFSDVKEETKIDKVYNETQSIVKRWSETNNNQIINFLKLYIQGKKDEAYQNMSMEKVENFKDKLKLINELIKARNKEAIRDLKMLVTYYDSKSKNKNTKVNRYYPNVKRNEAVANRIEKILNSNKMEVILAEYKKWHDWMEENKKSMLDFFEKNDGTIHKIEERLLKLIKPLIREKLKRKQNGKKNLRN